MAKQYSLKRKTRVTIELTILSCSATGIQMVELCAFSLVVNYVSARIVSIFVVCFFFKINSLVVLVVIVSVVFSYHLYIFTRRKALHRSPPNTAESSLVL